MGPGGRGPSTPPPPHAPAQSASSLAEHASRRREPRGRYQHTRPAGERPPLEPIAEPQNVGGRCEPTQWTVLYLVGAVLTAPYYVHPRSLARTPHARTRCCLRANPTRTERRLHCVRINNTPIVPDRARRRATHSVHSSVCAPDNRSADRPFAG